MAFVSHPLIKPESIESRIYQESILATAIRKNTLIVLPTGLGKTTLAALIAAYRLEKFPDKKILLMSPTKPLCAQHQKYLRECLEIDPEEIALLTGYVKPEDRRYFYDKSIIVATPQCVSGNTQIFLKGKGPVDIKELSNGLEFQRTSYMGKSALICDVDFEVLGFKNKKIQPVKVTKFWKVKADRTVKIITELKNFIETTPEHPLLTITSDGQLKWIPAGTLEAGQYIAVAKEAFIESKQIKLFDFLENNESLRVVDRKIINKLLYEHKKLGLRRGDLSKYYRSTMPCNIFFKLAKLCKVNLPNLLHLTNKTGKSKPFRVSQDISNELYYVIGAMLGDGHIGNSKSKGKEVVFSALDKNEVMKKFESLIFKLFGLIPKYEENKGLIYYSTALANLLILLGVPPGDKGSRIRVPYYVFVSRESAIYQFITGIFDTDGNASGHNLNLMSTISVEMAKDLKWLLLKLGIPSSIYNQFNKEVRFHDKTYKSNILFNVHVSGENYILKFLDSCNFDKTKVKILRDNINAIKNHFTRSKEILPVSKLLSSIRKDYFSKIGNTIEYYKFSMLSLDNVKYLTANIDSDLKNHLFELANLPFRWVKIKSIKLNEKPKWVYDLTVEDTHNFIGNWIVNHNTIRNDIQNNLIDLNQFSLLIFDECHRAVKDYAYTFVSDAYKNVNGHLIIGLTASPGGSSEKIKEICKNLSIEAVEIRTDSDEDVQPYLKELKVESIKVDLPENLKNAQESLKTAVRNRIEKLKEYNIYARNKRDLLEIQKRLSRKLAIEKNPLYYHLISWTVETIKIWHIQELLETQSIEATKIYINKMSQKKTRSDKNALNDSHVKYAIEEMNKSQEEHPKIQKLIEIITEELKNNKDSKIIVFSHFRDNIQNVYNKLQPFCAPVMLVGQSGEKGLTQKEQIDVIKDFNASYYNCLITSPIGEEGLHIPSADIAVFYDSVPSEIRVIQRRGRVGRTKIGKIIILMTKKSIDEGYYWTAYHKERKMKSILKGMQNKEQKNIDEFV